MFKNTFQSGFLSILYSIGSKPLQIWDKKVRNGHIKRITDPDIQSFVLEIVGTNVSTTYITCPADPRKTLGIKSPYLVMIVKNMKKYFTFEVQVHKKRESERGIRHNSWRVSFSHLERLLSKMQFFSSSLFAFHLALVHFVDCPMTDCKCLDSHLFQGSGRQECSTKIPSLQLPKYYQSQTIYLYNANAFGWWLEPNSIQFGGFYS